MHLPSPLRAVVGLVASAADEARQLPDRAIELPMLAVSTALQMSLRAQQRYASLAARGDVVLNRRAPTDEPPPWATFDEPVSIEELRRVAAPGRSGDPQAATVLDGGFGERADERTDDAPVAAVATTAASREATPRKAAARKAAPRKAAARKAAPRKAAARKAAPRKAAARKAAPRTGAPGKATPQPATKSTATAKPGESKPAAGRGGAKSVSKPRHTAPSPFDEVDEVDDATSDDSTRD